jgi:hypothetical protein
MDLSDLKQSVSTLSTEELMKLLKDIRANRRVSKAPPKKQTTTKAATPISLDALLANISQDQLANLISAIEAKKG